MYGGLEFCGEGLYTVEDWFRELVWRLESRLDIKTWECPERGEREQDEDSDWNKKK